MRYARWLAVALAIAASIGVSGCRGGNGDGSTGTSAAPVSQDSAFVAEKAAAAQIAKVAPDAVLLSIGTGGVVLSPPPGSWNLLYGSADKGRLYRVVVSDGAADPAEELGPLDPEAIDLSSVLPMDSVKVGADEAYQTGKVFLEKRDGAAPPNVMMSVGLVGIPNVDDQVVGDWSLTFLKGTSTTGAQRVRVDATSGEPAAIP